MPPYYRNSYAGGKLQWRDQRSFSVCCAPVVGSMIKRGIRAFIFVVCLALFVWQAYEIVAEYREKEIATKVWEASRTGA